MSAVNLAAMANANHKNDEPLNLNPGNHPEITDTVLPRPGQVSRQTFTEPARVFVRGDARIKDTS